MDRFIVFGTDTNAETKVYLKSSMDRFIATVRNRNAMSTQI
jgi:hypothetical protein